MEALHAIAARRSVRKFKSEPIPRELMVQLIEAGRLAPTARNVQPWEFVVVTDPAKRLQIAGIAEHGKFIADAPVCIVVLSQETKYYVEDCSAATTNILMAAAALGLGACWVAGDKKAYAPQIVSLCGAPSSLKLVSLIAVGQPVEIPSPPKRPLAEVIHWDTF